MSGDSHVERGIGPVVEMDGRQRRPLRGRSTPEPGWSTADQLIWTISLAVVFVLGFAGGARVASRSHEPAAGATACVTAAPAPAAAAASGTDRPHADLAPVTTAAP